MEYREQGYSLTQNWIDTSRTSLKTPSAKALAEAALSIALAEMAAQLPAVAGRLV
ncbi:hypothetical protein [Streptomyces sp. NPDC017529]|uniref:hypothetical protein n=1 Tax=Streptomyces sp. NPDC017529 TaxID=3365000 RepID=UPI003787C661